MAWVTKDDVRITWRVAWGCPKDDVFFFCKEIVNGKFCEEKYDEKKDPYFFKPLFFEER